MCPLVSFLSTVGMESCPSISAVMACTVSVTCHPLVTEVALCSIPGTTAWKQPPTHVALCVWKALSMLSAVSEQVLTSDTLMIGQVLGVNSHAAKMPFSKNSPPRLYSVMLVLKVVVTGDPYLDSYIYS